jgi:hypothetical protein
MHELGDVVQQVEDQRSVFLLRLKEEMEKVLRAFHYESQSRK